jgi:hypothetical protein
MESRKRENREQKMTPEQYTLMRELSIRATRLRENADGELSVTEAVTLAAVQLGIEPVTRGES